MSKTQSRVGVTITETGLTNYGVLNRDNASGTGLVLTSVSQLITFGASYPLAPGTTPISVDLFDKEITVLEGGIYTISFSTQILGTGDRLVNFHLNIGGVPYDIKTIKKELNTPNHFFMMEARPLLANQTISVSSYYETTVGSDNNIIIDHPTLLVTKLS